LDFVYQLNLVADVELFLLNYLTLLSLLWWLF